MYNTWQCIIIYITIFTEEETKQFLTNNNNSYIVMTDEIDLINIRFVIQVPSLKM